MNHNGVRVGWSGFLILLALVLSAPATAQYSDRLGGTWNNPASATITNIIMDRYAQRRLEANLAAKRSVAGSTAPAAKSNDASLRFRSTGTQLKTREIANIIEAGNPQLINLLSALLADYEKNARAAGKPDDLALALSFFFAANASVYHGGGQPPDPQLLALRETIASALVEGNALNGVTDRNKQEMYEALVLFTGFVLAAYEEGKQAGNAKTMAVSRQLAGQNLQAVTGLPPDKITFTAQGLSIERGPGAAVAIVAAAPSSTSAPPIEHWVILREFRDNPAAAAQRYNGKRVAITGAMDFVLVESGKPVIRMSVPAWSALQMFCIFPVSQKAAVGQLRADQKVVLEGTVAGNAGGVNRVGRVDLGSSVGRITLDECALK